MRKNNHRRRALSLLLSLMLVISTVTGMTVHAETSEDGVYEYSVLEDGTIEITDYYGSEDNLVIPSEIDGYTVTRIGYDAFYDEDFTSVSIPGTVTEIGPYAFQSCSYLTSIVIPDSVIKIEYQAFEYCSELSEITLPEHEMEIAPDAFDDTAYFRDAANWRDGSLYIGDHKICSLYEYEILDNGTIEITDYYGSENDLVIPSEIDGYTVTKIGFDAFWAEDFTNVSIPDTVTEIGPCAFQNCDYLISIVIPDSVIKIEYQAFEYCYELSAITLPEHEMEIAPDAFDNTAYFKDAANWKEDGLYIGEHKICGLYRYEILDDSSIAITDYYGFEDDLVIPSEIDGYVVSEIGYAAFNGADFTSVTIPNTVTLIGDSAFSSCQNLESIIVPSSVMTINKGAFKYCSELSEITLPEHEIQISQDAFDNTAYFENDENWKDGWLYIGNHAICNIFKYKIVEGNNIEIVDCHFSEGDIVIPSKIGEYTVTKIGSELFYNTDITSVTIPNTVVEIGASAFQYCDYLTSIVIPDSVMTIGERAFFFSRKLSNIILPEHEMNIASDAFDDTAYFNYNENWKNGYLYIGNHKIRNEFLYNNLDGSNIEITGYDRSENDIVIPSEIDGYTVTAIADRAFEYKNITNVLLPDTLTAIGDSAFYFCQLITDITIPDNVVTIGKDAFGSCNHLSHISLPEHEMEIAPDAFDYTAFYNNEKNWKSDGLYIGNHKIRNTFDYYILEDGTAKITGRNNSGANVIIPTEIDGYTVTVIGRNAFYNDQYIESLEIPNSVTQIEKEAFYDCSNLIEISLPDHDMQIASDAFVHTAYSEDSENWQNGWLYIGNHKISYMYSYEIKEDNTIKITNTFYPFSNKDVSIPDEIDGYKVTSIGSEAFFNTSIETVKIPDGVTAIEDGAFRSCSHLMEVSIPNSVVSIGHGAFRDCEILDNVVIPDSVVSIGEYAFSGCTLLENIQLSKNIDTISEYMFWKCKNLQTVTIPERVSKIGYWSFYNCTKLKDINITNEGTEIDSSALDYTEFEQNAENWKDNWLTLNGIKIKFAFDYSVSNDSICINRYRSPELYVVIPSEIEGKPVTEIDSYAFMSADEIISISVPATVKEIDSQFVDCTSLEQIVLKGDTIQISQNAFDNTLFIQNPDNWIDNWLVSGNYKIKYAFEYQTNSDGQICITDYNSCEQDVIIPDKINNSTVVSIGKNAFSNSLITSVIVPDTVVEIGDSAFANCSNLINIKLPEHTMAISPNAFKNSGYAKNASNWKDEWLYIDNHKICGSYQYTIMTDNTIEITDYYGFERDLTIPSEIDSYTVTKIGSQAFQYRDFSSVVIPDTVIELSDDAFCSCDRLTSVLISDSVTTIGQGAFAFCDNLTEVVFSGKDAAIASDAFDNTSYSRNIANWKDGWMYLGENQVKYAFEYELRNDNTACITEYVSPENTAVIPSVIEGVPVTEICNYAFDENDTLISVTLPEGIQKIGRSFADCPLLTDISLPAGIEEIDPNAFVNTGYANDMDNWDGSYLYLDGYKIMQGYDYFSDGDTADLHYCRIFAKDLVLPSEIDGFQVTGISGGYIGDNGNVGGPFANHVENIVIPKSIISASRAFYGNTSLKTITVSEDNPVYSSKDGVMFNKDQTKLLQYPSQNERTNYTIPNTVTSIAYGSFSCASSLKSITIPASVNSIDSTCLDYSQVTTIYGEPGSYAEKFAKLENLSFIPIEQEITPNPDSNIKVTEREDGILLSNVQPGSTVSEITAELMPGSYVITDKNGKVLDDTATIGTGTTISVYAGDQIVSQATVVILGDTTGDGIINVMDLSQIQNHVLGLQQMDEVSAAAVQFGKDTVGVSSLLTVNAHVLNLQLIDQGMELS